MPCMLHMTDMIDTVNAVQADDVPSLLYAELWVSLASLLRSYTAAHGLNRKQQATVELGEETIVVRAGDRWLNLVRHEAEIIWPREDSTPGLSRFTLEARLETHVGHE